MTCHNIAVGICQSLEYNHTVSVQISRIEGKGHLNRSVCSICSKLGFCSQILSIHLDCLTGLLIHQCSGYLISLTYCQAGISYGIYNSDIACIGNFLVTVCLIGC